MAPHSRLCPALSLALALQLIACDGVEPGKDSGLPCEMQDLITLYADQDGDGYGDLDRTLIACEQTAGWVSDATDCDDAQASVHPGAEESCNDLDDDCDGQADEDPTDGSAWYVDLDGDGFGSVTSLVWACFWPEGYAPEPTDCDDHDPSVNPRAAELCDGEDNDCDELIDEDTGAGTWYVDLDGDGYGDPAVSLWACEAPDDYVADNTDCDDTSDQASPEGVEICDGLDNDCDDLLDELDPDIAEPPPCYTDSDSDGYGTGSPAAFACFCPEGTSRYPGDCNDTNALFSPGVVEVCNTYDDDCDADIDEAGSEGEATFYLDSDRDGHGVDTKTLFGCFPPEGYARVNDDCDDSNGEIHPEATERCDGIDQDCDDLVDEDLETVLYQDLDHDGYGLGGVTSLGCGAIEGWATIDGDCDDTESRVHPGGMESCDEVDEDCDGEVDEGLGAPYYSDEDRDGHGVSGLTRELCRPTMGWAEIDDDCDDSDEGVHPEAQERCDGVDNDCDGQIDQEDDSLGVDLGAAGRVEFTCASAGLFTMGSSETEEGRVDDERQHLVELSHDFAVGVFEITQGQYQALTGENPSFFSACGDDCPVEQLTWHEAAAFANLLSELAGLESCYTCDDSGGAMACALPRSPYLCQGFRLPTEAEWEYAARGGWSTAFPNGGNLNEGGGDLCDLDLRLDNGSLLREIAWFCGSSMDSTHPVGGLGPNPIDLHDLSGNVQEWCGDWYADFPGGISREPSGPDWGDHRVVRGGSWDSLPHELRLASRAFASPEYSSQDLGFRLVLSGR